MKNLLLIACLISSCLFIRCAEQKEEGKDTCADNSYYDTDQFCINNGTGYESWFCEDIDPWNDYNVWIKEKTVTCERDHKCRCRKNDWNERRCECYNARPPPNFPDTGVIRWNGTYYYNDNWWVGRNNPRTVYTPGEIHKDRNGRFLYKWTKIGSWPDGNVSANTTVHFKILIPHNKAFLEYTGVEDGKKECTKNVVKAGGDLTAIWTKEYYETFSLRSSTYRRRNKKFAIETWSYENHFEDGMFETTWTVKYNRKRNCAIPIKYYHTTEDGFVGELIEANKDYTYERLKKDDESFQLRDYCKE